MSESEEFESGCCNPFCCYVVYKPIKELTNTHGYRQIKYLNGTTYTGETKDMFFGRCREGSGKMTYTSGSVYEGWWKGNVKEGHGKITYKSGNVCEGEWKEGKIKQNRTTKKIPLNNAENIFLQNIEDRKQDKECFTQQNTKKNKTYIDITKGEKVPQENINKKDHLKIIYSDHGATEGAFELKQPICALPNANGRKSYYISSASCHGSFVDPDDNNLIDKIKDKISNEEDCIGFFSHAGYGYGVCIENTIDKNNQIGLNRVPCCKKGLCVNDKHFNEHKDEYIQYFVILNEGNEQNIYQIPHELCYWREVLIDDTKTSNPREYSNKFMEAVDCLKHGKSFTFKTKAQVEVDGKLVEKDKTITISGKIEKVEVITHNVRVPKIKVVQSEYQSESQSINNISSTYNNKNNNINNSNISDIDDEIKEINNANNKNSVDERDDDEDELDDDEIKALDEDMKSVKVPFVDWENINDSNITTVVNKHRTNIKNNTITNRGNGECLSNH